MAARRDQVYVGLFVLIAAAVLIGMVFAISGAFGSSSKSYHAYFPFAGGLEGGATVRYAGGPKVGRVEKLTIDPQNPARIEVVFSVQTDLPVKTDSHVKIMSMSPLGDNHLEILPGGAQSALAPPGSLLQSETYADFNALTAQINDLAPQVKQLIQSLNDRATELKVTVERVNDLLSASNRANLSATLADTRGMIEENRPQIKATIQKLDPVLQDLHKTINEANQTLTHVDAVLGENRADVRQAVIDLRKSLNTLTDLTGRLDQTLDANTENIDELLENFRRVSQNLKEFTDTIKKRPYSLIRATNPPDHKPGDQQ